MCMCPRLGNYISASPTACPLRGYGRAVGGPDVGPEIVVVGHAASPQPASVRVCVLDLVVVVEVVGLGQRRLNEL